MKIFNRKKEQAVTSIYSNTLTSTNFVLENKKSEFSEFNDFLENQVQFLHVLEQCRIENHKHIDMCWDKFVLMTNIYARNLKLDIMPYKTQKAVLRESGIMRNTEDECWIFGWSLNGCVLNLAQMDEERRMSDYDGHKPPTNSFCEFYWSIWPIYLGAASQYSAGGKSKKEKDIEDYYNTWFGTSAFYTCVIEFLDNAKARKILIENGYSG